MNNQNLSSSHTAHLGLPVTQHCRAQPASDVALTCSLKVATADSTQSCPHFPGEGPGSSSKQYFSGWGPAPAASTSQGTCRNTNSLGPPCQKLRVGTWEVGRTLPHKLKFGVCPRAELQESFLTPPFTTSTTWTRAYTWEMLGIRSLLIITSGEAAGTLCVHSWGCTAPIMNRTAPL